ncbi:AhpC/TSA family protein [Aestuariibaculum marinum]|uniref:AhpC/TSA family protein n=1 Tax=Aestuariibaculum marinum TaxID=2683592 RepID=A0A8J6U653_9FLAO|nr:AhpC/TSA family protein [Aestuariibaculum marinum]MBD0825477.1 AhpC/TSA family protein [Aestuariibaculum marinum]
MKNLKYLIIALLIFGCKEKETPLEANKFRIDGEVTGMKSGNLYIFNFGADASVDTLKVEEGQFKYEGTINEPVKRVYLSAQPKITKPDDPFTTLYLEPAKMKLNVDIDHINKTKLTGSKTMDDSYRLELKRDQIKEKYSEINSEYRAIRESLNNATTESEKKEYSLKEAELSKALQSYNEEISIVNQDFIANNPQSYITLSNLSYTLGEYSQEEAQNIFDKLPEGLKNSREGKVLEKEIQDKTKGVVGAKAGNFNTLDINGKPIKLQDFEGRYLLIDFWASWCVPCRKGNPHLLDLYAQYSPKGFEIIGVSDDDTRQKAWREAVKKDGIGVWRHVLRGYQTSEDIADIYNVEGYPTKILVDPNGIIVGRYGNSPEDNKAMDEKLDAIFN